VLECVDVTEGERVPRIEVEGLARRYGDIDALRGVSFTVAAGQICGYLGPNGAGKSTTMRILAGLLAPDQGTVRIAGHDVVASPLAAKRALGYAPESGALFSLLTVREHLELCADLHELLPDRAEARMNELVELFGLGRQLHQRIDTLSKGQRQKVVLSTTLLHEPEVLLLDEPLSGLDVEAAAALKELLRERVARGGAVLYSSHILDVVERIADRVIILAGGEIVADAPTDELLRRAADKRLESIFRELSRAREEGLAGVFLETPR
jgi:ABC-2 type transport system ATP-binding protein